MLQKKVKILNRKTIPLLYYYKVILKHTNYTMGKLKIITSNDSPLYRNPTSTDSEWKGEISENYFLSV